MSQSSYSLGQYVYACEYNFKFRYCPQDMNKKNKGICLELCTIYLSLMLMNISSERILYNLQDAIMNPKTAAPDDTITETYLNKYMKVINDYPSPLEEIIKNIKKNTFTYALIEFNQNTDCAHCIAIYKIRNDKDFYYIQIYDPNIGIINDVCNHEEEVIHFLSNNYLNPYSSEPYVYEVWTN